jgi:hypothetical protein
MLGVEKKQKDGDPQVAAALDQLGIKYELDDDGDYRVVFQITEERTQQGVIRSRTFEFAGVEMREIYSIGLSSFGPFDARTCNLLLEHNRHVKVGCWAVAHDPEDNHLAIFLANVAAGLDGELLLGVLHAVLTTADEFEARLSGRDDF